MSQAHLVFVYGTLRKGEANHHYLTSAKLIAEHAWTYGRLFDTGEGYPGLARSSVDKVYGELYLVNDEHLYHMDELEEYHPDSDSNLYNRIRQTIFHDNGKEEAFLYLIDEQHASMLRTHIQSGDWKLYRLTQLKDM